jgi:hypothetical protein
MFDAYGIQKGGGGVDPHLSSELLKLLLKTEIMQIDDLTPSLHPL